MSDPAQKHEVMTIEDMADSNVDQSEVQVHIHAKTIIAVLVCTPSHISVLN